MTPNQLKNSILQLAIQGKLTESWRLSVKRLENRDERKENCLPNRVFCHNRHCEPAESWHGNPDLLYADAETLLKTISEEKEALIKQGKLKKDKNESTIIKRGNSYFEKIGTTEKGIDDELPFEIPDTWCWARLGNISFFNGGYAFKSVNYVSQTQGIRVLRISDFSENGISDKSAVYHPEDITLSKFLLEENDIVICMTGGTVGKSCHIKNLKERFYVNQRVADIKISKILISDYIYIVISSAYIQAIVTKNKNSTNDNISAQLINSFLIPLPPLAEQRRIVAKIEELLPMVEKYGKAYNKLEVLNKNFPAEIKKSILQYTIQGKLVEQRPEEGTAEELLKQIQAEKAELIKQGKLKKDKNETTIFKRGNSYFEKIGTTEKCIDDELPFEIPDTWRWVKLGEVIRLTSGQDLQPSQYNDKNEGIPYLTGASNIDNEQVVINRWTPEPRSYAYKGDLLLTCKGTVGKTAILKEEKVHIARQIMAIRLIYGLDIKYVEAFIKSQIDYLKNNAKSIIPGIERNKVLNLLFPLPPLNEQRAIVTKIEKLFSLANTLTNK